MAAASKAGVGLTKVPPGLVAIFKEACAFCDVHTGSVVHWLEPTGTSRGTAAPGDAQTTARDRRPAACDDETPKSGANSRRRKLPAKPVVEVRVTKLSFVQRTNADRLLLSVLLPRQSPTPYIFDTSQSGRTTGALRYV